MDENELSKVIVDAAFEVYRTLGGPGLLESLYEEALAYELESRGVKVERQKLVPVSYKGRTLSSPLRLDMLVGGKVIVECKSTTKYNPVYEAQTLTYLRLTGLKLGLVTILGAGC